MKNVFQLERIHVYFAIPIANAIHEYISSMVKSLCFVVAVLELKFVYFWVCVFLVKLDFEHCFGFQLMMDKLRKPNRDGLFLRTRGCHSNSNKYKFVSCMYSILCKSNNWLVQNLLEPKNFAFSISFQSKPQINRRNSNKIKF